MPTASRLYQIDSHLQKQFARTHKPDANRSNACPTIEEKPHVSHNHFPWVMCMKQADRSETCALELHTEKDDNLHPPTSKQRPIHNDKKEEGTRTYHPNDETQH